MDKVYSPQSVEAKWHAAWRKAKAFRAAVEPGKAPFVVVIPPPNVTGALHIGHALNNTLQDVLVRWHRLCGQAACWVPGADHGGIATQSVMEKQLRAEKLTRHQMGRGKFLERMHTWTRECKGTILSQLGRLGCALDWDREAFTLDEARGKAVYEAFRRLHAEGLVRRGERMVNWCVRCGTALADIEVEYEDRKGKLWHIRYPAANGGSDVVVATTRPETMLGDAAVAVNPRDARYAEHIGKAVTLPLMKRPIPIVADDAVDFAFGTGAVKVTPAHDPNDFEIAGRHGLPAVKVIGPDGRMTSEAGAYAGLSREAAREKVLADLGELLVKTEDHPHSVGVCYRCGSIIEPLLSLQWFVSMTPLARRALRALDAGEFRLHPETWARPYREWLAGIRDWCISRQIWWGHRIPVWYCLDCNKARLAGHAHACGAGEGGEEAIINQVPEASWHVSAGRPPCCPACGGARLVQDPDVLDTWFSSALWPFSVFGWPDPTADLEYFYPTSTLVTGYEILYLWVARMQMLGLQFLPGKGPPFADAVIHGIVRDKSGKKMSKSLGNVIDPLVMMDRHGTDAFRFSLVAQAHPGRDIPFSEDSITGSRNFANKLWNSTRFVLMNLPRTPKPYGEPEFTLLGQDPVPGWELADYWVTDEFHRVRTAVEFHMAAFRFAAAADVLYAFLWDEFCDWYVELAKIRLTGPDGPAKEAARWVLVNVLNETLKLLHPFMPYITEELYEALKPYTGEAAAFLFQARLPALRADAGGSRIDPAPMRDLMAMIQAVRATRSQLNVPPGLRLKALLSAQDEGKRRLVEERRDYVLRLARLESIEPAAGGKRPAGSATAVAAGCTFYLPLEGVIDFEKERRRLTKDLAGLDAQLAGLQARLSNPGFVGRAPRGEVDKANSLRQAHLSRRAKLVETLQSLG